MKISKGWGPWRYYWISVCSKHCGGSNDTCNMCLAGCWVNAWWGAVGGIFHDHCYPLWLWWVNRPASRKKFIARMRPHFPNFGRSDETDQSH